MRLAAVLLFACGVYAQDTPVFRTDISLVHVDAEVTAADGRILTGFSKEDFRVLDEGKEQPVLYFSAGQEALDLILLFDVSGSMRPKVEEVAAAAREGVRELRQGDCVAVMVFNTHTRLLMRFTDDLEAVQRSIREDVMGLRFGGGTFIQNAVSETARQFMRQTRTERRRAVLIITDDFGQRTRKESTVVRELWEADALLTGLIVRSKAVETVRTIGTIMHPYLIGLQAGVKGIAEKTGGDFIHAGDAGAAFQESMRRIRNRYSIYYAMPEAKPGSRRVLRVELSEEAAKRFPKARVRARTGYVTPGKP
jgi:VWFA-related protein